MATLKDFLVSQSEQLHANKEVFLGGRFKDEKGKPIPFVIKPMLNKEHSRYQSLAQKMEIVGKRNRTSFDMGRFNEMVIVNHCVEPNFKDAQFLKDLNVTTPEQALSKSLMAGEVVDLAQAIIEASGFDSSIEEEVAKVEE